MSQVCLLSCIMVERVAGENLSGPATASASGTPGSTLQRRHQPVDLDGYYCRTTTQPHGVGLSPGASINAGNSGSFGPMATGRDLWHGVAHQFPLERRSARWPSLACQWPAADRRLPQLAGLQADQSYATIPTANLLARSIFRIVTRARPTMRRRLGLHQRMDGQQHRTLANTTTGSNSTIGFELI